MNDPVNGWVLLDKPSGPSSNQVLGRVKRLFKTRRAGFVGTLDPLATGLLPIALNEACKAIPYFPDQCKAYEFTVHWGIATDTEDALGQVVATSDVQPSGPRILEVLPSFLGEIAQVPPQYSAIHVNGKRAYALARQGVSFLLPKRHVMVYALTMRACEATSATFWVRCSRGTYVRSLARDLAHALGTLGHITMLRRTHVGNCSVDNAISLDNLQEFAHNRDLPMPVLAVGAVLDDIPAVPVSASEVLLLRQGQSIPNVRKIEAPIALCISDAGVPVGFGMVADGIICPKRIFNIE
jgi:tRNA pseudouridine55 synthase